MGSIRYTLNMKYERHWSDDWHKFCVEGSKVDRQLVSGPGQLSLFEEDSIKHLKPKKRGRKSKAS